MSENGAKLILVSGTINVMCEYLEANPPEVRVKILAEVCRECVIDPADIPKLTEPLPYKEFTT